jgi:hypothetical protein
MNKNIIFIAAAAVILIALFVISSGNKVPPIPTDALHKDAATNEACVACHAPGKQSPLKPTHPPKEQCVICHKAK